MIDTAGSIQASSSSRPPPSRLPRCSPSTPLPWGPLLLVHWRLIFLLPQVTSISFLLPSREFHAVLSLRLRPFLRCQPLPWFRRVIDQEVVQHNTSSHPACSTALLQLVLE